METWSLHVAICSAVVERTYLSLGQQYEIPFSTGEN